MSEYTDYLAMRAATGYKPPQGRDRCHKCGLHTPTQRHRQGCPEEAR